MISLNFWVRVEVEWLDMVLKLSGLRYSDDSRNLQSLWLTVFGWIAWHNGESRPKILLYTFFITPFIFCVCIFAVHVNTQFCVNDHFLPWVTLRSQRRSRSFSYVKRLKFSSVFNVLWLKNLKLGPGLLFRVCFVRKNSAEIYFYIFYFFFVFTNLLLQNSSITNIIADIMQEV